MYWKQEIVKQILCPPMLGIKPRPHGLEGGNITDSAKEELHWLSLVISECTITLSFIQLPPNCDNYCYSRGCCQVEHYCEVGVKFVGLHFSSHMQRAGHDKVGRLLR